MDHVRQCAREPHPLTVATAAAIVPFAANPFSRRGQTKALAVLDFLTSVMSSRNSATTTRRGNP